MGINQHYRPAHAGTYSQTHDFSNNMVEQVNPRHIKPALMADYKPMGANR